jgi:hypothetical protein
VRLGAQPGLYMHGCVLHPSIELVLILFGLVTILLFGSIQSKQWDCNETAVASCCADAEL